jgi:hypothetical protein
MLENSDTQLSHAFTNLRAMQLQADTIAKEYQKAVLYNQAVYQIANLLPKDLLHDSFLDTAAHHPVLRTNRATYARGVAYHMLESMQTFTHDERFAYVQARAELPDDGTACNFSF